jgi:molybdate transport repressor ModE-like protein
METEHIKYLKSIVEQGSISAAAREHGMTQSALTKIVSRAESLLGASLFERKSRGVDLTSFGALFLNRTAKIEQEMFNLSQDVRAMKAGDGGVVSIGVGQFWIGQIVPNVVAKMTKISPNVQIKIATSTREENLSRLQSGDIDMLLGRITDDLPAEMAGEQLAVVKLYLLVRQGHPLTKLKRTVKLKDLGPYGWVLPSPSDPTARHISQTFTEMEFEPNSIPVEAVSRNFTAGLLQASNLITVVSDITTNKISEGLCRLNVGGLEWSDSAGVIRLKERTLLPCCNRFLDLLRDEMGMMAK